VFPTRLKYDLSPTVRLRTRLTFAFIFFHMDHYLTGIAQDSLRPARHHATAAANDANRSPGSVCVSRQVTAIGISDSCFTYVAGPRK
jgi:hypothetical protein